MPIGIRCVNGVTVPLREVSLDTQRLSNLQRQALKSFEAQGRYHLIRMVGSGAFSKVFLATRAPGLEEGVESLFAVKMIADDQISAAEILAGMTLNHPHIAAMEEYLWVARHYFVVYEYVRGCNLQVLLDRASSRFDEEAIRPVFVELLGALEYCHKKGVVHRDLKPENLMLDRRSGKLKLVDFGLCFFTRCPDLSQYHSELCSSTASSSSHPPPQIYILKRDARSKKLMKVPLFARCALTPDNRDCGTPFFAAPEVFIEPRLHPDHLHASDFYSFGVTLYYLLVGDLPYQHEVFEFMIGLRRRLVETGEWDIANFDVWSSHQKAVQRLKHLVFRAFEHPGFLALSLDAQDLLRRLIEPVPFLRIKWHEIYSHPWIRRGLSQLRDLLHPHSFSNSSSSQSTSPNAVVPGSALGSSHSFYHNDSTPLHRASREAENEEGEGEEEEKEEQPFSFNLDENQHGEQETLLLPMAGDLQETRSLVQGTWYDLTITPNQEEEEPVN